MAVCITGIPFAAAQDRVKTPFLPTAQEPPRRAPKATLAAPETPDPIDPETARTPTGIQPVQKVQPPPAPPEIRQSLQTRPAPTNSSWVSAEYLLWWVRSGPLSSPIVVTSNRFTDLPPAALGQPGTRVLLGDSPMGYGTASGMRFGFGVELAPRLNLEAGFLMLENRMFRFGIASNGNGSPLIANPFFNPALQMEDALLNSNPDPNVGPWAGATFVHSHSRLLGWDLNLAASSNRSSNFNVTGIFGFRSMHLNEDLSIDNTYRPLVPGVLTFRAIPVGTNATLFDTDRFGTSNTFYGGQVGAKGEWKSGRFSLDGVAKVALGVNQQIVNIDGFSILAIPGLAPSTAPGGTYAQVTNMGRHYKSTFSVIPEVGINVGVNLTERLKASVGYSFIYWSNVARPGSQIDHTVHEAVVPTHQNFTGAGDGRPAFAFRESDYFAHGVNFGLLFTY